MIDAELHALAGLAPDRPLDGLETDIWAGVDARRRELAHARVIASCQGAVLVLAVLGALAAGRWTTPSAHERWLTAPGAALAPSALLIGG